MGQIVVIQYAKLPNVNVLDSCSSSCFPLLPHSVCYTILSVLNYGLFRLEIHIVFGLWPHDLQPHALNFFNFTF